MDDLKSQLQTAFDSGFVPKEIKDFMDSNGHDGQVWTTEVQDYDKQVQTGEDAEGNPVYGTEKAQRLGVGYKIQNSAGGEESHIVWYDDQEVQALLEEYNGGKNS